MICRSEFVRESKQLKLLGLDRGRKLVPFGSVVHPEELALLTKVLNDHCARFRIPYGPERDEVGAVVLRLYRDGKASMDELAEALAAIRERP